MPRKACWLLFAILAACVRETPPDDDLSLPSLGANAGISVSGISSGGYMATQYQLAFADDVQGVAVVAAGPWGCSQGSVTRALAECVSGDGIELKALRAKADELRASRHIDARESLRMHHVFLFHGAGDTVVRRAAMQAAFAFYASGVSPDNIVFETDVPATHGWVVADKGTACDAFVAPYLNDCDYDLAGKLLEHIVGTLEPPSGAIGELVEFGQAPFGDASLDEFGFAYIPNSCRSGTRCRVHVAFHGCSQSAAVVGKAFAEGSGLNRWAETNSIVVLYPQVKPSRLVPLNPLGCWDWWGYTGDDYLSKSAPQLAAVHAMVQRLQN